MKTYKIVKEFIIDAKDDTQAEDCANWIGYVALDSSLTRTYLTNTISIEELEE